MASVTVDDFKIGKDSRKGPSVSDADRLLQLTNAYITTGKVPRKRQGSNKDVVLETGTIGLITHNDKLNTFYGKGALSHVDPDYVANLLNATVEHSIFTGAGLDDMSSQGEFAGLAAVVYEIEIDGTGIPDTFKWRKGGGSYTTLVPITGGVQTLSDGVQIIFAATTGHTLADLWTVNTNFYNTISKIHFGDVFNGFLYMSAEYDIALVKHHYLDGSANTLIKDTNCPNSKGVLKMVDKIFAVNGDVVNFSATNKPRDWTTISDAGFLSTGLKQRNAETALGLGQFGRKGLVMVHEDGAQLWTVDPDPALHVWERNLDGFASRFPRSVRQFAGDLFLLSDSGVRSVSEIIFTQNLEEEDVGNPIDKDIQAVLLDTSNVLAARFNKGGQYWLVVDSSVFVYTFSRRQKISAWSIYSYPWSIDYMEEFRGDLYFREGNNVYIVDKSLFRDDGLSYEAVIQSAFLNAKAPGIDKQWKALDTICEGTAEVSFRWDPNSPLLETAPVSLLGDTTPAQRAPIEINSPSLSFLFKNSGDEAFELQSFTAFYEELTAQ